MTNIDHYQPPKLQTPGTFQKFRNEYEIEPQKGHGAHARIRTGDLFLTKEVLEDDFPVEATLRSNAEAIANNRCLAALPWKCPFLLR